MLNIFVILYALNSIASGSTENVLNILIFALTNIKCSHNNATPCRNTKNAKAFGFHSAINSTY